MEEKARVTNQDRRHPVFSKFEVKSQSGRTYSVELRGVNPLEAHCTCVDFGSNGLGTCKHVESVLIQLRRRERVAFAEAQTQGSARWEILPDLETQSLRLIRPPNQRVSAKLQRLFGASGVLKEAVNEELLKHLRGLLDSMPNLRISQEVSPWYEGERRREQQQQLRREYELNVQAGRWPMQETRVPLFPYQREGMLHLAFTERALLADEMGLGKTIQAIAACALLKRLGSVRRVLVVTPASLKAEWEEQIQRFTDLPVHLMFGGHHKRLEWLRTHSEAKDFPFFTVVNYEQVVPAVDEFNQWLQADVVILDEAQRIKNWNTRISRTIKRLRSRYAFILTGTPIENRIDELRSLVDFLDPSLLGPLFRFNRDFYSLDDRGQPTGYKNLDVLHQRVRPILLRRRKSEVETELPPRTDRNHFVQMTKKQRTAYAVHEQEVMILVQKAERRPLSEKERERLQIELGMMRMICDSNYILDKQDRECPKLKELERVFEDCMANDAKVLVFSEWARMLELVRELCERLGMEFAWHTGSVPQQKRRLDIQRFKDDPDCRVFLTTDAGATGLNLQVACVVVNCDLPWNPARLEQRIARAWRKNQPRLVTVVNLITEDSIEHRMLETLATKRSVAESVLDQAGKIKSIELRRGRKAMVDQLREFMARPTRDAEPSPVPTQPAAPQDPTADFARSAYERLGNALVHFEEQVHTPVAKPILVVVLDQVTPERRHQVEQVFAEFFVGDPGLGSQVATLEIMNLATYEAIQRWVEAGILQSTPAFKRQIPRDSVNSGPPPLSDEEQRRAADWRARSRHAARRGEVLLAAEFKEEARASFLESLAQLAHALAIESRITEPSTLDEAMSEEFAVAWKGRVVEVHEFVSSGQHPHESIARLLREL